MCRCNPYKSCYPFNTQEICLFHSIYNPYLIQFFFTIHLSPHLILIKSYYYHINVRKLNNKLGDTHFDFLHHNHMNINDKFTSWYSIVKNVILERTQTKKRKSHYNTPKKPWITKRILVSLATRCALYGKSVLSNDVSHINIYKA